MVRIINGEIVSDDDPRVKRVQRRSGTGRGDTGGGGGQSRAGYGRVVSLLDSPAPSDGSSSRGRGQGGEEAGQVEQRGVLKAVAEAIGVHGRFVRVPGALGVPEKQVPVVNFIICAIAIVIGGCVAVGGWWKVAGVIVFAYIIINQQGRSR